MELKNVEANLIASVDALFDDNSKHVRKVRSSERAFASGLWRMRIFNLPWDRSNTPSWLTKLNWGLSWKEVGLLISTEAEIRKVKLKVGRHNPLGVLTSIAMFFYRHALYARMLGILVTLFFFAFGVVIASIFRVSLVQSLPFLRLVPLLTGAE